MIMMQKVDLYKSIINSVTGPAPLTIRVGITPSYVMTEGGTQHNSLVAETYVLLSALPTELQDRVKTAVQALIAGR